MNTPFQIGQQVRAICGDYKGRIFTVVGFSRYADGGFGIQLEGNPSHTMLASSLRAWDTLESGNTTDTPRTDAVLAKRSGLIPENADLQDLSRTLERELSAKTAECQRLREALERITESHARLEAERGSVVGTLTANARAALVTP